MLLSDIPRIGLLFTSFVELITALSALALVIFLFRRWKSSDLGMRVYVVFWFFTFFVWITSMTRYLLVSFGYENSSFEHILSVLTQMFIFSCGPVLFYYVSIRTLQMRARVAVLLSILPFVFTVWSFVLLLSQWGVTIPQITYFSADAVINKKIFYVFGIQIAILLPLLTYDVFLHYCAWRKDKTIIERYRAFHSLALILYLALGTIDQAKIFIGWPLVVFRMFYSASFLFVYVVIAHYEVDKESYLLTKNIK